ncbi:PD-(D/E)XK nuclease family protein [Nonomuraea angiospora]
MITGQSRFDTGIESSTAILPGPPPQWSFSSLREIRTCPRRYALARASYPDLWDGHGYPQVPALATIFGHVIHDTLEMIVKAIVAAGCESAQSPEAVTVLRHLGGYTKLIERTTEKRLAGLQGNPRLSDDLRQSIHRRLHGRAADARVRVQAYISKAVITPGGEPTAGGTSPGAIVSRRGSAPLSLGSHAEATLTASHLRLRGRVDLIRITESGAHITDYKTGDESPGHAEQLRLYALLWSLDADANPGGRPVAALTAAYPGRDIAIPVPSEPELHGIQKQAAASIEEAEAELAAAVPRAIPSTQNCSNCDVRHLCDAYWSSVAPDPSDLSDQSRFDCQGLIGAQNGQHSWWFHPESRAQQAILIQAPLTGPDLPAGRRVRILGLRINTDPEAKTTVASMNSATEIFRLT